MIFKGKDYDTDIDSRLKNIQKRRTFMKEKNIYVAPFILGVFLVIYGVAIIIFFKHQDNKLTHNFYQMCIDDEIVELRVDEQGSKQSMTYYKLNEKCDWGIE